jgi:hypothetical protein
MTTAAPFRCPGWAVTPKDPATRLRVWKGDEELEPLTLGDKALLFGRKVEHAPKRGTCRLDHDSISREHAVIVHAFSGETFIMDLASRYGTKVDGSKVEPRKYCALAEGAKIQFGESSRAYKFTRLAVDVVDVKKQAAAKEAAEKLAAAKDAARKAARAEAPAGLDDEEDPMAVSRRARHLSALN